MICFKKPDMIKLKEHIINYLKAKGKICAALLHKLENYFCKSNSKFRADKNDLLSCLLLMNKERIIDIIIPEPFQIKWEKKELKDLLFLNDGTYFVRLFSTSKQSLKSNGRYYFDSRTLNFNEKEGDKWLKNIEHTIKTYTEIKYKVIIYYPNGSKPINIYEPFKGTYYLEKFDFRRDPQLNRIKKIDIPINEQKFNLKLIQSYRKNFMCLYITLIESIHKEIMDIQLEKGKIKNYKEKLNGFIEKFAYYCEMFTTSDWIELSKANPYKWETFFKFYDIPIQTVNMKVKSIRFFGRTFETCIDFKYCILIDKEFKSEIEELKKIGYHELNIGYDSDRVAIGSNIEIIVPCPAIEYYYFLGKYIIYYHLFLLFYHVFSYIKKIKANFKFTEKEQTLYKMFLPVMKPLFNTQIDKIMNKLVFNYYTLNPDELELIYNKYLVNNVRDIEKRMYSYFLIKYNSRFKLVVN